MGSCTSATEVVCLRQRKYQRPTADQRRTIVKRPTTADIDTSVDEMTNEFKTDQDMKDGCVGLWFQKDELISKLSKTDAFT